MRDNGLAGAWRLTGEEPWETGGRVGPVSCVVPGNVLYALEEAGVVGTPVTPREQAACEWVSRRVWTYSRTFLAPDEPYEGRSEKHYLHVRVIGSGVAFVDGEEVGRFFGPWREAVFDITRLMEREGAQHSVSLRIERPVEGEGPVPLAGVMAASIRSVAFCRIEQAYALGDSEGIAVTAHVRGTASGKVTLRYRVLLGDELVASLDAQERLIADRQTYRHRIAVPDMQTWGLGGGALYSVQCVIQRGGVRCDMALLSAAHSRLSLVPPRGAPGALPYALREGEERVFVRGVNMMPPVSAQEIESFAQAGANMIRFHGPVPPDEAALRACDDRGLAVWLEAPADPASAGDAAALLGRHPCGLALSAGHALQGPDGAPAGSTHPRVAAFRARALEANPALAVFPSSPSGPVALLDEAYEGRRLCHDVHGPFLYEADTFARLDRSDALLLSKAGFQAPAAMPSGEDVRELYGGYLAWLESLCGPQDIREKILKTGRFLQGEAIRYAVFSARRREAQGCAGLIVWCGNAPGGSAVSHALLDPGGAERPAVGALRRAWADVALSARLEKDAFLRGETVAAEIFLHAPPGGGLTAVAAQLCDTRGNPLKEELWNVPAREEATHCGSLRCVLPAETPDILLLRLTAEREGEIVFTDTYVLPIPQEGEGRRFEILNRLPGARPTLAMREGRAEIANDGPEALIGVTAHAGRRLLFSGTLLPWEREGIDIPEGFLPDSLLVEALNS